MTRMLNMEIEPNAPDWSNETPSDHLLVIALKNKLDELDPIRHALERRHIKTKLRRLRQLGFEA
jgi:hypothetical protein